MKIMAAGDKKNNAGGSWSAGCIENFNLAKVEVAENNLFSSTRRRFLL